MHLQTPETLCDKGYFEQNSRVGRKFSNKNKRAEVVRNAKQATEVGSNTEHFNKRLV
jgi:hypothetical protein